MRNRGTGIVVNVIYFGSSEKVAFELRGTNNIFLLIVVTDFVATFRRIFSTRSNDMHSPRLKKECRQACVSGSLCEA